MFSSKQRFEQIKNLQNNPKIIRNISIVAHVDHGKTTLSDSLLSTNNIVHQKSVGKLRYLDSRKDEQLRGITMKSSSISLIYNHQEQDHLVNLIDSPGHVEFSSEVSAALRITDGALILVDVIEGVSAQTYTVIRQCYQERVKSILVLNKIDRLINELQMSPSEAYVYISQIIEQVNAILSKFINVEKDQKLEEKRKLAKSQQEEFSMENELYEEIEKKVYFLPEKGNIVFSSAIDQWAFSTFDFAKIFAKKLQCNEKFLQKVLYGEYYFNAKTKKVTTKPVNSKHKPMFVDFILKNIWAVYEKVQNQDIEDINKLVNSLKIEAVPQRYFQYISTDQSPIIQHILSRWLPLDKSVLDCVVNYLPSPIEAQKDRIEIISKTLQAIPDENEDLMEEELANFDILEDITQNIQNQKNLSDQEDTFQKRKLEKIQNINELRKIKQSIANCDNSDDAPLVIFISKMCYLPKDNINERGLKDINQINQTPKKRFIAFARIFCGKMKRGQKLFVIQAKKKNNQHVQVDNDNLQNNNNTQEEQNVIDNEDNVEEVQIDDVYLMMSQYLDGVTEVGAGNILALGNLDQIVFKSATLSSYPKCPTLLPIHLGSKSILKVALMAKDFKDQPAVIEGLKKLNKFDPSVEVFLETNGNVILATCGQVHLERCITDLEEMTQVEIKSSEPIVSFKETVVYKKLRQTKNLKKQKLSNLLEEYDEEDQEDTKEDEAKKKIEFIRKMSDLEDEDFVDNTEKEEEVDIRYGLLQMQEDKETKEGKKYHNFYGQEKEVKRLDYFNSGKTLTNMSNVNLLEIQKKPNVVSMSTPNLKLKFKLRCIGFNFELAEWLEKQSEKMRIIFTNLTFLEKNVKGNKKFNQCLNKAYIQLVEEFLEEFQNQVQEHIKDKSYQKLILENLVCFGPDKFGPNMLISKYVKKNESVICKLKTVVQEYKEYQKNLIQKRKSTQVDKEEGEEEKNQNKEEKQLLQQQQEEIKENNESSASTKLQQPNTYNQNLQELIKNLYNVKEEEIINSIIQGFQMAIISGPLSQEPMIGVCYILEEVQDIVSQQNMDQEKKDKLKKDKEQQKNNNSKSISEEKQNNSDQKSEQQQEQEQQDKEDVQINQQQQEEGENNEDNNSESIKTQKIQQNKEDQEFQKDCYGPITGQIISTIKDMCLESFLGACPRLVEGMYLCHLQCDTETYPKVWDVLNRRRGKPIQDELQESSNLFIISAHLPIIESFNFYSEMLVKTSGRVNAQLVFDTWNILETDPFFVPFTQEELEEHGEKVQTPNFAKDLIDKIRKRKGIYIEQKIIESAEKQSNMNKKR